MRNNHLLFPNNSQNCCWMPTLRDLLYCRWTSENWEESGKYTLDGPYDTHLAKSKEGYIERVVLEMYSQNVNSN